MSGKIWTSKEINYLQQHYPDRRSADIAKELNRSLCSVYSQARILGLKKSKQFMDSEWSGRNNVLQEGGKAHRFPKGHTPYNKGKKQSEYMDSETIEKSAKTRFQNGHKPHNTKYDGALSIRKDSYGIAYIYIRVAEEQWELLHRKIWEQHYGPIPKRYNVVFKDKDQANLDINNLELVSNQELMERNSYHNRYPKELAKLIQAKGALNRQINKILKNEQQQ